MRKRKKIQIIIIIIIIIITTILLVLEQTVWQLQSYEVSNSYFGDSTYTIPGYNVLGGGNISNARWTFYNDNGWLIQRILIFRRL